MTESVEIKTMACTIPGREGRRVCFWTHPLRSHRCLFGYK